MSGRWHLDLAAVGVVAAVAGWTVAVALARSIAVAAGSGSLILAVWLAARDEVPRSTVAIVAVSALAAAAGRFASAHRDDPRRLTAMLIAGAALVVAAVLAGRAWAAASDHWALTFVGAGGTVAAVLVAVRGPVAGRRSPPDPWAVLGAVAAGALWLSAPDTELAVALGSLFAVAVVGHVFAPSADRLLSGAAGWAATWSLIAVSAAGAFRGRPEGLGAGVVALVAAMAWPGWRSDPSPWPITPAVIALAVTACGAVITARTTGLADEPGLHLAVAAVTVVAILGAAAVATATPVRTARGRRG